MLTTGILHFTAFFSLILGSVEKQSLTLKLYQICITIGLVNMFTMFFDLQIPELNLGAWLQLECWNPIIPWGLPREWPKKAP